MKQFIHELSALEAAKFHEEINLDSIALEIRDANRDADLQFIEFPWNRPVQPWQHTGYTYGYIQSNNDGQEIQMQSASSIQPDPTLKNAFVNISLDKLRVFDYPGKGRHNVLFKFTATNKVGDAADVASFNQLFVIQEGESAAIHGYPIFLNLKVGTDVLKLDTEIVNVSNENDDKLLATMDSPVSQNGMKLIGAINPALSIVTEYANGITKMLAERNKNVKIVAPSMGMYFDNLATHMKIREGSFVAIQISDPAKIIWNEWVYNPHSGMIKKANDLDKDLPYNYFIFSISKSQPQ